LQSGKHRENMDQVEFSDYELDQLEQLVQLFNNTEQGTFSK